MVYVFNFTFIVFVNSQVIYHPYINPNKIYDFGLYKKKNYKKQLIFKHFIEKIFYIIKYNLRTSIN